MNPFYLSVIVAIVVNGLFFAYAATKKTDVVTDLSYSLSFALVSLFHSGVQQVCRPCGLAACGADYHLGCTAGGLPVYQDKQDQGGPPL
jgi:hypothetical protein